MQIRSLSFVFCCILCCLSAEGQGTFRNTDFEVAQIPQNQPNGVVSTTLGLPLWTVYYGTNQLRQSPDFERWLELGKKVQKPEAGPTVAEWIGMRQKREPEYKGRTLSKWLQSCHFAGENRPRSCGSKPATPRCLSSYQFWFSDQALSLAR